MDARLMTPGWVTAPDAELQVHTWPGPAGDGVLCEAEGVELFHFEDGDPVPFVHGIPDDAPILEAWGHALAEQGLRAHRDPTEPPFPPDGLYLFVEPRCPDCGYSQRDAAFHMDHKLCPGKRPEPPKAELLPVVDVTEEWRELHDLARRGRGAADRALEAAGYEPTNPDPSDHGLEELIMEKHDAQALRFTAPGREPFFWTQPASD